MKKSSVEQGNCSSGLRAALEKEFQLAMRPDEPDWRKLGASMGFAKDRQKEFAKAAAHLWLLPFSNVSLGIDLLEFQYSRLDRCRKGFQDTGNVSGLALCRLFDLLMVIAQQGNSSFPQSALHLARLARESITSQAVGGHRLTPLLSLLVDSTGCGLRLGLNTPVLLDPSEVIRSEYERSLGILNAKKSAVYKWDQYCRQLEGTASFREDWCFLKAAFPIERFRDSKGIIRRSATPERNWQPPVYPDLRTTREQFGVTFDIFCWKWFLYGMRNDEPLVEKLTYTFTPFGTQIFIPGYWNLDSARDLDWKHLSALHKARRTQRLNPETDEQHRRRHSLLQVDTELKKKGIRGEERYRRLKKAAGLALGTDDAQIRRMLRRAKADTGR
jgi:hypothetical protein